MSTLAIIPARAGSKGIPGKNFRKLGGRSLMNRAIDLCNELRGTLSGFVVSSDIDWHARISSEKPAWRYGRFILRPPELAQDDTPMIAVVQHALAQVPGHDDQIIVLLQPTQPFRTPKHVTDAMALLRESQADSVVSVVELPKTHNPELVCTINTNDHSRLTPYNVWGEYGTAWIDRPVRRQDASKVYRPDGTVYAFWRKTIHTHGTIYGDDVRPLIIPADESCELDTEADWQAVEGRWKARVSQTCAPEPLYTDDDDAPMGWGPY